MSVERHLVLQEMTLLPSAEWSPRSEGWIVAHVAEGAGYWLNSGEPRELSAGDMLVTGGNSTGFLRASRVGPLRLQFFLIQPRLLNGVLATTDGQQLDAMTTSVSTQPLTWPAREPLAQRFARIAANPSPSSLSLRCRLLQLWADAVAGLVQKYVATAENGNLQTRFLQLLNQMSQAELAECSLSELAAQLHCSDRHLSRLFHDEFGVPFRARQTELRLMRAREILADSNVKIIHAAYGSGYRHLGLFNAMFKKRFGMTPREWRRQNLQKNNPPRPRGISSKLAADIGSISMMLTLLLALPLRVQSQTNRAETPDVARLQTALHEKMQELDQLEGKTNQPPSKVHIVPASTNGPAFTVNSYLVEGNSTLAPGTISDVLTNVPAAFGTNVTFDAIRVALGDLQMAYRERGFATVSIGLPQQKLTNGMVKVKVTEGRITSINVVGNKWYSTANVLRALPSLHTNMLLNSHVFQRELDRANASRDRQISPIIGPGEFPGTTELTLKVNDQFPMHGRVEVNNQATPGTPDIRVNSSIQYDNLWNLDHQIGLQYSFAWEEFRNNNTYSLTPLDDPLVVNYSGYYRIPLSHYTSVEQQIEANPSSFGYSEVTHQFNLPPATSRPELTIYASRAISDTGVLRGPKGFLVDTTATNSSGTVYHPLSITTNSAGQNITLNEDLGMKLSVPLPTLGKVSSTISFGADYKHYRQASFNTNENFFETQFFDQQNILHVDDVPAPQGQAPRFTSVDYFPLNVGFNGSIPDKFGTTFFNANANFNFLPIYSGGNPTNLPARHHTFAGVAYSTNAESEYLTLQLGADRLQRIYKDWSIKFHADGQCASGALFSNEQYAMGGVGGVRGYTDGEAYGDTGWRLSIEPQTPLVNIGMVDGDIPFWIRSSVFLDYGRIYLREAPFSGSQHQSFCGAGWSLTGNIGAHLDARLTIAVPLITDTFSPTGSRAGDVHVYFGVGAQF